MGGKYIRTVDLGPAILLLFVTIALPRDSSWGFAPNRETSGNKVTRVDSRGARSFTIESTGGALPAEKRIPQWKQFTRRHGDAWRVRWNEATGTPLRIHGPGLATGLDAGSTDKMVEQWARDFVDAETPLLGVRSTDLDLVDLRRAGGRTHVLFQQTHRGVPIYGAYLKMSIDPKGDLSFISSACYPDVTYREGAKLRVEEAVRIAADRIADGGQKARPSKYALLESRKIIFPMPAAKNDPFRLCYLLRIHVNDPLGDWIVAIDASRGIEYVRYNDYRFGTISGTVAGEVLPAHYDDPPMAVSFENQNVHAFSPTPSQSWDMTTDPGWSTEGLWTWGTPNGNGGDTGDLAPTSGHTGSNVYAYNLTGGYGNSLVPRNLTTTAINCTFLTGTHLSFWQWLGVEDSYYDHASILVSNNGTDWTTIWSNPGVTVTSEQWERVIIDISSVADGRSTVYIRWVMGPSDWIDTYCGWYIDDVGIYAFGGTGTVSQTGDYSITVPGTNDRTVYGELSGPYQDVYYDDADRLSYLKTVPQGTNSWSWQIPSLSIRQSWDLNVDPGWSRQGEWAWGIPQGNEGDPTSGHTGSNIYGYNLAGAYPNFMNSRYLTTGPIDCTSYQGTHLRFWRWLGVEYYDYAPIEVSNDNVDWTLVYVNKGYPDDDDTEWREVTFDISAVADGQPTVYIRWGMGPTNYSITYCGWNIDDIAILSDMSGSDVKPGVYDYDEVNVFHHMTVARNRIKSIDPGFTGLDYPVPAMVRAGIAFANAYWDGRGVNFGEGDGVDYRNLALFADVIYHEYNHGITHQIYPEDMLPYSGESGALDEAWGDYFSCDITDEPMIGEGDLVIGQPYMRNLDNTLRAPDDWNDEVHDDGRIVGGAMWDLRESLGSTIASHLLHFARFNLAETFFDYYEDVLLADDTNGNFNDGTPHMLSIAEAFGAHGIGGIQLVGMNQETVSMVFNNGKLDAGETGNLVPHLMAWCLANNVQVGISSSDAYVTIIDGTASLGDFGYATNKANASDPLTLAIDPLCPNDHVLDLTISIGADGAYLTEQTIPYVNAPDQILYDEGEVSFHYGYGATDGGFAVRFTPGVYPAIIQAVRLWPSSSDSPVEIDLHVWDDDGPGGSPGTELMASKTVTVPGSDSWEEFAVGDQDFDIAYEWTMDSDPGWSVEGGWAYGVPTGSGGAYGFPDPTSGFTGAAVYGYNLSGDYPNNMSSPQYLTAGPIDCSGLSDLYLRFQRWLGVEDSLFDEATLEVSNDGTNWEKVWENSGEVTDSQWIPVRYRISGVADGEPTVYIRWGLGPTDASWTYCGWNIDDVQIGSYGPVRGGIVVTSGDVYLGWTERNDTYYNGVTVRYPNDRSWAYDPGIGWAYLASEGSHWDFLVRARLLMPETSNATGWKEYR